jgi:heterodisulfide reductase subunit A-like polyferredoxin
MRQSTERKRKEKSTYISESTCKVKREQASEIWESQPETRLVNTYGKDRKKAYWIRYIVGRSFENKVADGRPATGK